MQMGHWISKKVFQEYAKHLLDTLTKNYNATDLASKIFVCMCVRL